MEKLSAPSKAIRVGPIDPSVGVEEHGAEVLEQLVGAMYDLNGRPTASELVFFVACYACLRTL